MMTAARAYTVSLQSKPKMLLLATNAVSRVILGQCQKGKMSIGRRVLVDLADREVPNVPTSFVEEAVDNLSSYGYTGKDIISWSAPGDVQSADKTKIEKIKNIVRKNREEPVSEKFNIYDGSG